MGDANPARALLAAEGAGTPGSTHCPRPYRTQELQRQQPNRQSSELAVCDAACCTHSINSGDEQQHLHCYKLQTLVVVSDDVAAHELMRL